MTHLSQNVNQVYRGKIPNGSMLQKAPWIMIVIVSSCLLVCGCNNQFKEKVSGPFTSSEEYRNHKYSELVPVGTSVTDAKK